MPLSSMWLLRTALTLLTATSSMLCSCIPKTDGNHLKVELMYLSLQRDAGGNATMDLCDTEG
jgi:hypothetical protein